VSTVAISEQKRFQHQVAMTVTLVSFAMLFAALFLGYFLVRFNVPVWPPVEIENRPQLLPFLSTLVIALSSWTFWRHQKAMGTGKTWLHFTLALGLGFLALQWSLWATLKTVGVTANNGMVSSMFYAFTWLHAAHIVGGLGALLWIAVTPWTEMKTENVGKFWHFLGVVWFLMYLMLFVF
jgi:cytochrome c oxidase subunit III